MEARAGIATIGSLANGGIVALFGIVFCPRLPLIGQNIKSVCLVGVFMMTVSLATAAASTKVTLDKQP